MYDKLDEISFKELIGYSIRGEQAAHDAYLALSKSLEGLMSEKFKNLAKDEKMHKEELLKLHEMEFGDRDYVVPDKEGLPPHEGEFIKEIKTVRNLIEAIDRAMDAEDSAYELYNYLSKRKEQYRTLFKYIALMEKGHYQSLKAEKYLYEAGVEKFDKQEGQKTPGFDERNILNMLERDRLEKI
ncbi:MAG: ferritin-like domain-containing protein [Candidatus Saliniplasma sp.]